MKIANPLLGAVLAASLLAPARAQEPAVPPTETPLERFERLETEAAEAYDAWLEELRAALKRAEESKEDSVPAVPMIPPLGPFVEKFQAAAAEYAGSEEAVRFLVWLTENARMHSADASRDAWRTLIRAHVASAGLEDVAPSFPYLQQELGADEAARALARVEAESPHAAVRAWAVYARVLPALKSNAPDSGPFIAAKAEVNLALEGVKARDLRREFESTVRLVEQFGIGMVAPDIDGIDLDGVAFRLSDHRGKVILVDFWGDW